MSETAADDDVIVLEDGRDEAPAPKQPAPKQRFADLEDGDESYGAKVQKRISQLSRKNREAEQRAASAQSRAEAAERALLQIRRDSLTATDAAYDRDFKAAQERAKRAYTEADVDAASEANADMAKIAAVRERVKADLEATPKELPRQQQAVTYTEATQAYIDENPWFTDDPDARTLAESLHVVATRRGLKVDTPKYFEFISNGVFKQFPEHAPETDDEEDVEVEAPPPPPVAAARRSVPGSAAPKSNRLPPLTKDEADQARRMGLTLKEFATSKAQLIAAGKIGVKK